MTFPVGEATIYYYAPFFWSNGGNLAGELHKNKKHLFDSIIHGTIESVKNIISWHVTGADDTKEAWCMM